MSIPNPPIESRINPTLLEALAVITPEEEQLRKGSSLEIDNYTSGKSFVIHSHKLTEKGNLLSIRPHTRFTEFPRHTHNFVEIMYMCRGTTRHVINDTTELTLETGDLLILNQHACHSIARADENDIAVNFIIQPEFLDTAFDMIGPDNHLSRLLLGGLRAQSSERSYLHFRIHDILPIQNLIENMIWSLVNRQPNHRHINRITMGVLFTLLLNHTDRLTDSPKTGSSDPIVVEIIKEIEENYKNASLSQIARKRGVSVAYLSRLVKKSTDRTYKELLQEKRLSKATQLLRETRLSVQDIIHAVGYDNTGYFFRLFEKKYNVSPRNYRLR